MADPSRQTTPKPIETWCFRDADDRLFRVEDHGPGRVWVLDVMSPTGNGWWELREKLAGFVRLPA